MSSAWHSRGVSAPRSLVAVILTISILVVQARVVVGGQTWADPRYHTEIAPSRLAAAASVQRGEVPTWWDGSGLGVALAAEPSHGALDPLAWLAASPRALDLLIIAQLWWAALGVALWARRRKASDPSAVLAGLLVATTGALASAALRGAMPAIAQLPWLGLAATALAAAETPRARAGWAAAIGALIGAIGLTGELGLLFDAVAIACVLGARRTTWRTLATAIAAGLAIAAVQWVPAIVQLGAEAGARVQAIPLARLVELVLPGSFGSGDPDRAVAALAGLAPFAPSLYLGAPLLGLAAIRALPRRALALVLLFGALALIVGRGGWPAWLGAPELHVAALAIVLGAHAAHGVDALLAGERRALVTLGIAAACAAVILAALGIFRSSHADATTAIDRALLDGGLGAGCIVAAVAIAALYRERGWAMPLVLALLAAPAVGASGSLWPTMDRDDDAPRWAELARDHAPPRRLFRPPVGLDDRALADEAIATLGGTSGARWGVAAAWSHDPARAPETERTWLAAGSAGFQLLERFGIDLAILPAGLIRQRGYRELGRRGTWALIDLPVAPPASVVTAWRWAVSPDNALPLLFAPGGGQLGINTIVLRGRGESRVDTAPALGCSITAWTDGDQELVCGAARAGYAVVSSSAAAGWQVEVDGEGAVPLTADVLRRAVALPAGVHRVHWSYRAPDLALGGLIALAGLALLALLLALSRVGDADPVERVAR